MTEWDAPNQQVVRADASAPWDEGTGGAAGAEPKSGGEPKTKAELLEHAHALALDVTDANTKAEIQAAIDEAGG